MRFATYPLGSCSSVCPTRLAAASICACRSAVLVAAFPESVSVSVVANMSAIPPGL
jgi:hypothetical protein